MTRPRQIDSAERSMLIRLAVLAGLPLLLLLLIAELAFAHWPLWLLVVPDITLVSAIVLLLWSVVGGAGHVTGALLMPGGILPARQYSEQDALVARGEFAAAADSYRSLLVAYPLDLDARLGLGALLAGPLDDAAAAERCFLEIRSRHPSAQQEQVVGNALIDLYRSSGRRNELKGELARFARLNHRNRVGAMARKHLRELIREDAESGD
jgi:hypothetical protein